MRLSICIPTYNRAEYLPALLESIIGQSGYECELEVVISDNASSDDTPVVIERYRERLPQLVYHRNETNQGADRNFLKVVELASGDFCWLMGSDDLLEPGGVAAIERALKNEPSAGGAFLKSNSYDYSMESKIPQEIGRDLPDHTVAIEGAEKIFSALGEYVGYISANVVDRKLWNEIVAEYELEPYFNAWIHVYVIGRMMQRCERWVYIAHPCVGWRSGNDSFLAEGVYKRLEIDVAGYHEVTRGLFGTESPVYRHIMRRILRHARYRVLHAKAHRAPASFFRKARALMTRHYSRYPAYWTQTYPLLIVPGPAIRLVRALYGRTLKPLRISRANG